MNNLKQQKFTKKLLDIFQRGYFMKGFICLNVITFVF